MAPVIRCAAFLVIGHHRLYFIYLFLPRRSRSWDIKGVCLKHKKDDNTEAGEEDNLAVSFK